MKKKVVNPILSIPSRPLFQIPVHFPDTFRKAYLTHLDRVFAGIAKYLQMCTDDDFAPSIKNDEMERITGFQSSILEVIQEYFAGHPSKAYVLFDKALADFNVDEELRSVQVQRVDAGSNFYRIQKSYDQVPKKLQGSAGFLGLKKELDLFHPPFERRRAVGTNRFSISGYPSLYLSQTLHTSYSECFPQDDRGSFHAISFKNIRPLYVIDLTKEHLTLKKKLFEGILPKNVSSGADDVINIVKYLGLYQLVLATHTKVSYKATYKGETYYFKAEYIIPQLLLQWVKLQGLAIDGIRYQSCTASSKFPSVPQHFNYVLPVKSNLDKGFCHSLLSLFSASKPFNCLSETRNGNVKRFIKKVEDELILAPYTPLAKVKIK